MANTIEHYVGFTPKREPKKAPRPARGSLWINLGIDHYVRNGTSPRSSRTLCSIGMLWEALGRLGEALGRVWGDCWRHLGAILAQLGRLWEALGMLWEALGGFGEAWGGFASFWVIFVLPSDTLLQK